MLKPSWYFLEKKDIPNVTRTRDKKRETKMMGNQLIVHHKSHLKPALSLDFSVM